MHGPGLRDIHDPGMETRVGSRVIPVVRSSVRVVGELLYRQCGLSSEMKRVTLAY